MSDLPETFVPGFHDEAKVRQMKYIPFGNTGLKVSKLALGTGGFSSFYGSCSHLEECKAIVRDALRSGINYIDTAPYYGYGLSEEILGKCLEGIPRKAYYVATKVARYESDPKIMFDFSAQRTEKSIETSLKKLGTGYLDILQVHDIEFAPSLDVVLNETLPVVAKAKKDGKAKFIGVTGYPVATLAECIKKSKIQLDMVLCYTRLSILDNTLKDFLPEFKSKSLGIVNAAPHCLGLLSGGGPQPWHPAGQEIKDVCTEAREYCKSKGIEIGRLALYYALTQEGPHTVLVGINTLEILNANLEVYFKGISNEEKEALEHIKNKFFSKLTLTHWEGLELAARKKALEEK